MQKAKLLLAALAMTAATVPAAAQGDDVAVVQRHVDTYKARNLNAFMGTFAPDAVVVANGIQARGKEQIRAFYSANFAPNAPTISITDSGRTGDKIYIQVQYNFANGQSACCTYSEYTVRNGQIVYLAVSG